MTGRGRFITLEGGEGVGKSTLAAKLAGLLEQTGRSVVLTREPGGTPNAEAVRGLLLGVREPGWTPLAEALLFSAARAEHLERLIRPRLAAGDWVICDRFADSTRAYQLASDPALEDAVAALERITVGATQPDLTLVLDAGADVVARRLASRGGGSDAIEGRPPEYHARVRAAFRQIAAAAPERCVLLEAGADADSVAAIAWTLVRERLGVA